MSQQQHLETNLRRSSRRRDRKSYNDYFSDDDVLTEHDDDDIEEQELEEEEEYEDGSDDDYIQEEQEEASVSGDSSDNYNSEEEEAHKASVKDINPKFACGLCSNILSDPYIIPACCHRFCCKCIQESIKAGNETCPTCGESVSSESLRRDEMMGRLLTRYKILQDKIQKKKMEEGGHEIHKKHTLESAATHEIKQEEIDNGNKVTEPRTRKNQKREISSNENSSKTSSSDRKHTKLSAQAKSSSGKKDANASKNKKRKAKYSNEILTFNERIRCLQDFKKKYGHVNVPKDCRDLGCHEGLGRWCSNMRSINAGTCKQFTNPEFKLTKKRMKVLEDMGFRWTKTKTFDEYFQELHTFKAKHGHCLVPKEYKENKKLGSWCARLRLMKSGTQPNTGACKLTPERIQRLEDIGFKWWLKSQPLKEVDSIVSKSQDKLGIQTLVASANGNIPTTDVDTNRSTSDENATLNADVDTNKSTSYENATQKKEQCVEEHSIHKETKHAPDDIQKMTIVREGKRNEKSTVTTLKKENECRTGSDINESSKRKKQKRIIRSFDDHFSALQSFKQKKGHCNVSSANNTEDPSLVNWVFNVRRIKAGRMKPYTSPEAKLTEYRIAKLDALGFEWIRGPSHDKIDKFTFDDYVRDLKAYKAKYGDCYVSINDKDHKKLGRWVSKLRMLRAGTMQPVNHQSLQLTEERITELNSIGFRWKGFKTFDEYMDDLREFKAKYGHCDVPFQYPENKSLGFWVGKIRKKKLGKIANKGSPDHRLTNERIAQLERMGFNWRLRS